MSRKTKARRMRQSQKTGLAVITVIIAVLAVVLSVQYTSLKEKDAGYEKQQNQLEAMISEEQERGEKLAAQKIFVQTKQYIEQMAREKLNLVYPDEILFREED